MDTGCQNTPICHAESRNLRTVSLWSWNFFQKLYRNVQGQYRGGGGVSTVVSAVRRYCEGARLKLSIYFFQSIDWIWSSENRLRDSLCTFYSKHLIIDLSIRVSLLPLVHDMVNLHYIRTLWGTKNNWKEIWSNGFILNPFYWDLFAHEYSGASVSLVQICVTIGKIKMSRFS